MNLENTEKYVEEILSIRYKGSLNFTIKCPLPNTPCPTYFPSRFSAGLICPLWQVVQLIIGFEDFKPGTSFNNSLLMRTFIFAIALVDSFWVFSSEDQSVVL